MPQQERIICLNGPIDDTVSASVVAQLLWLESDAPDKPITMYIHSPGGSVTAGLAIYDTMEYVRPAVSTVCLGQAASMASLLLAGGAPGKRYALPHSSVMIHQPLGGTQGPASDILIYANQIQRTRAQVNEIYRRHLNHALRGRPGAAGDQGRDRYDLRSVEELMERDKYLTAEEAREMGIVDEILTRRPGREEVRDSDKEREKEKEREREMEMEKEREREREKEKEKEKEREKEKEKVKDPKPSTALVRRVGSGIDPFDSFAVPLRPEMQPLLHSCKSTNLNLNVPIYLHLVGRICNETDISCRFLLLSFNILTCLSSSCCSRRTSCSSWSLHSSQRCVASNGHV